MFEHIREILLKAKTIEEARKEILGEEGVPINRILTLEDENALVSFHFNADKNPPRFLYCTIQRMEDIDNSDYIWLEMIPAFKKGNYIIRGEDYSDVAHLIEAIVERAEEDGVDWD